jgi:hypothetical protein
MPATGTTTDCIAVATLCRGVEPIRYASSGTDLGRTMGRMVFECVMENILMNNKLFLKRSMLRRASERKIDLNAHISEISERICFSKPPSIEDIDNINDETTRYLFISGLRILDEYNYDKDADKFHVIRTLELMGGLISEYVGGQGSYRSYKDILRKGILSDIIDKDPSICLTLGLMTGSKDVYGS